MVAYRAETAMANLIVKECGTFEQARALLRDVFLSEADLIPELKEKILESIFTDEVFKKSLPVLYSLFKKDL
ncbi:MAG TPA: hypothetical protein DD381_01005 [Lentisphaeria bacterium]|nr:MAG: hypothetical protein A2X47_05975 [Lentisphaerae bacterium GWF2_38_69]HBM14921.1 hypothetical protein [Lentisphaeria bacterium]